MLRDCHSLSGQYRPTPRQVVGTQGRGAQQTDEVSTDWAEGH